MKVLYEQIYLKNMRSLVALLSTLKDSREKMPGGYGEWVKEIRFHDSDPSTAKEEFEKTWAELTDLCPNAKNIQHSLELDYEQYKLVKEALHERRIFLQTAPYLSAMLPIMLPIYKYVFMHKLLWFL